MTAVFNGFVFNGVAFNGATGASATPGITSYVIPQYATVVATEALSDIDPTKCVVLPDDTTVVSDIDPTQVKVIS